tara:strand:- start:1430 stop:1831 length:402 start_codon:yes stop_codon:yes gene_type:complete
MILSGHGWQEEYIMQVSYYISQNDCVRQRAMQLSAVGGISVGLTLAAPFLSALTGIIMVLTTSYCIKLSRYMKQCKSEVSRLPDCDRYQYNYAINKRHHRCSTLMLAMTASVFGAASYVVAVSLFELMTQTVG